ncbi:MAG: tetratricopeptide repeat protein [Xenococcaceae cyanobacterium]
MRSIYADRQIEYAVHALCGSRGFNYQIYKHLGQALDFAATQPDFEILTEFSFVWQDEKHGEDWYRIHDLLRRLYRENPQETTQRAHSVLEAYWREKGNISEAIYHANCLDWEEGLTEWVEVFEEALRLSRYDLCRALLEVRSELNIGSYEWLGYISASEGNYFAQLARHAEAEAEFTEAIAAYEKALTLAPDDVYALNNQGLALTSLGELQASLTQNAEAVESYRAAIAAYDQALTLAPDYINALNNKGLALISLGNLYSELSMNEEAIKNWQTARSTLSQSLKIAPNNTFIQNLYDELETFLNEK